MMTQQFDDELAVICGDHHISIIDTHRIRFNVYILYICILQARSKQFKTGPACTRT